MQIQKVTDTNFQSRNQTIRFADDIARRVNSCYPRISSSFVDDFVNIRAFRKFRKRLDEKTENLLRIDISESFDEAESFLDKIHALINPVKKYRLGNCGESSKLAAIAAKINGIKNCHIAHLCDKTGEDIDHAILFVNDKKPYIIDCWLGFADYVQNALCRYKNEYNRNFKLENDNKATFYTNIDDEYNDFLKDDFTRKQINKLRKIYPNLFIKRGYI